MVVVLRRSLIVPGRRFRASARMSSFVLSQSCLYSAFDEETPSPESAVIYLASLLHLVCLSEASFRANCCYEPVLLLGTMLRSSRSNRLFYVLFLE